MTNRENSIKIINFDKPERVVESPPGYILQYTGSDHEGFYGGGDHLLAGSKWTDIWGVEWHKEYNGVMGFPKFNPLSEINKLRFYEWPDPNDDRICKKIYDLKDNFPGGDQFVIGSHRDTLWEKAYMIVGMENLMAFFYTDPDFVKEILHRIINFHLGIAKHYINCGVEMVKFSDDLGTQNSLLLSPKIIKQFLYPEYKRLFNFYREKNIIIEMHSCGHIEPLINMYIDLGVNILNPIQSTANNIHTISNLTMNRMALAGAVDNRIIFEGTKSSIINEVKQKISILGKNGGYFCRPDQNLPFPEENIKIFKEALYTYGNYPLT